MGTRWIRGLSNRSLLPDDRICRMYWAKTGNMSFPSWQIIYWVHIICPIDYEHTMESPQQYVFQWHYHRYRGQWEFRHVQVTVRRIREGFGMIIPSRKPSRGLKGLGGRSKVIGQATIQIPFVNSNMVINVGFSIVEEEAPSFLSKNGMIVNGLCINLQGGYQHIWHLRSPLKPWKLLFHLQVDLQLPYVKYTDRELRAKSHTPRIRTPIGIFTYKLLKRKTSKPLDHNLISRLHKLSKDCKFFKKNSTAFRRFKMTVGTEYLRFNHRFFLYTMFID